jgi:hypothetical protein
MGLRRVWLVGLLVETVILYPSPAGLNVFFRLDVLRSCVEFTGQTRVISDSYDQAISHDYSQGSLSITYPCWIILTVISAQLE